MTAGFPQDPRELPHEVRARGSHRHSQGRPELGAHTGVVREGQSRALIQVWPGKARAGRSHRCGQGRPELGAHTGVVREGQSSCYASLGAGNSWSLCFHWSKGLPRRWYARKI